MKATVTCTTVRKDCGGMKRSVNVIIQEIFAIIMLLVSDTFPVKRNRWNKLILAQTGPTTPTTSGTTSTGDETDTTTTTSGTTSTGDETSGTTSTGDETDTTLTTSPNN
jgi:hypothetical protein